MGLPRWNRTADAHARGWARLPGATQALHYTFAYYLLYYYMNYYIGLWLTLTNCIQLQSYCFFLNDLSGAPPACRGHQMINPNHTTTTTTHTDNDNNNENDDNTPETNIVTLHPKPQTLNPKPSEQINHYVLMMLHLAPFRPLWPMQTPFLNT